MLKATRLFVALKHCAVHLRYVWTAYYGNQQIRGSLNGLKVFDSICGGKAENECS